MRWTTRRLQYDHIFLERHDVAFTVTGLGGGVAGAPVPSIFRSGGDLDLATVRVNYRWGGAAIARY